MEYYRPVIIIGLKGALDSHEIRLIHSAPSLGQSITSLLNQNRNYYYFIMYREKSQQKVGGLFTYTFSKGHEPYYMQFHKHMIQLKDDRLHLVLLILTQTARITLPFIIIMAIMASFLIILNVIVNLIIPETS